MARELVGTHKPLVNPMWPDGNFSTRLACLWLMVALFDSSTTQAVTVETVAVGNPGNAGELCGKTLGGIGPDAIVGGVAYEFRIGKYEVTNAQYVEFLNAVDPSGDNALGLYNKLMSTDRNGGIELKGNSADGSKYVIKAGRGRNPVVFVTPYDAFRFANWLHNGQGDGDTETGAYRQRSLARREPRKAQPILFLKRVTNMPASGLRSAPDEAPARTAEVFRAAAELMVEKGYGGTSIGDIAQAVGMTKAGLYHHISGKQDMLYQILNHAMDRLERLVIAPVRLIEDPEERLRQLMQLQIQGSVKHGLAFTVLFSEINHLAPAQQKEIRGRVGEHRALIREALLELADEGRLRKLDVDIATMLIVNVFAGIARWKHQDFTSDEEHLIQETVAYTMAALLKPVR